MHKLHILIFATLYMGFAGFANPSPAQTLSADQRAEVENLREGEMRKLIVHEEPVAASDAAYFDLSGAEYTLAGSNGHIRLVNFWATWCAPCRREKPSLDDLHAEMSGPDFEVIAIATGRNDPGAIKRFNEDLGIGALDTYVDPKSALASGSNVPGLPVTIVLNRQGDEIARLMGGADWSSESAKSIVSYLIGLGSGT